MTTLLQSFLFHNAIRRLCAFVVMMVGLFASQTTMAQTVTYSDSFTNGVTYSSGSTQWDNWGTFRAGPPTSNIQSVTISGSLDPTGRTCSTPALAQQIMDGFRTSTGAGGNGVVENTVSCDGFNWNMGNCAVSGVGIELNVGSTVGVCQTIAGDYVVRPRIGTQNWGGVNGNQVTQTMSVSYTVVDPLEVINTNDSGAGSLRDAVTFANANAAEDAITFNIPGSGVQIITPLTELPLITDAGVSIDGSTQTGASCGQLTTGTQHSLMIHLDGVSAGLGSEGLKTDSDGVTFKGISITNFDGFGVSVKSGADNFTLECAYISVAPDGVTKGSNAKANNSTPAIKIRSNTNPTVRNSLISGQEDDTNDDGLRLQGVTGGTIEGNIIGLNAAGTAALGNADIGILLDTGTSGTVIGGTTAATRNLISGNGGLGIQVKLATDIQILGNYIGLGRDGTTTFGNGGDGIVVLSTSTAAIYGNRIVGNGGLGIDLNGGGVTANDGGDGDTGPNDLLNFPVINAITVNGTTIGYDVDLDVPANTNGYRVEFFRNSDLVTGNGEGGTFLGFIDTGNHVGGSVNYTGTFTASETVTVGQIVSTTTTRKTASSFDITSEFSENHAAVSTVDPLEVTNTNDSGAGSLRDAITFANANTGEDAITFDIPGVGPHVIAPLTGLPQITDDGVSIDGTSQSGAVCNVLTAGTPHVLKIQIDGVSTTGAEGLLIGGDNVALSGLSITGFDSRAIRITGTTNNGSIDCSYVGVNPDGITKNANARSDGVGSVIAMQGDGGTLTRSVVSGNDDDVGDSAVFISGPNVVVTGSLIGLSADGTTAIGNGNYGFNIRSGATNTMIGGTSSSDRNIISGNGGNGLNIDGTTTASILGNYIGTDYTGLIDIGNTGDGISSNGDSITIGGITAAARNVISGNNSLGIYINGGSNTSILGNYIGLGSDGMTPLTNVSSGIQLNAVSGATIGDGSAGGRNVIGSVEVGLYLGGTNSSIAINGNYFNTDSTGNSSVQTGYDGIVLNGAVTTLDIIDNVVGRVSQDKIEFWGGYTATGVTIQGNKLGVGADGVTNIGGGVDLVGLRIWADYVVTGLTLGGFGAGEGNVIGNNQLSGVYVDGGTTGEIVGNTILDNVGDGVELISSTAALAIYANSIYDNGGLGIDLGTSGVTANDGGDADTGANDFLNFPVINDFSGTATTLYYDFDLDVPSNANGYRVEFFKNDVQDSTLHGEGQTFLGFVDVAHSGGNLTFTGSFTGSEAIDEGDFISATTTRKTGVSSYDITSEFSLNYTSDAATELTAAKSVHVFDPTSAGLYALPGNDVVSSMTVTNIGNSAADTDSIVIIDAVPSEMTFYNGDMDDGGPATQAVHFIQTGGANLSFTYASDAAYSNSGSRPANMAGCTYTPSAGYDSNVTYVCFNPKGAMAAGDPDPTVTLQYRARIK